MSTLFRIISSRRKLGIAIQLADGTRYRRTDVATAIHNITTENGKMDLAGKHIVYVGGFGGIGFETVKALLRKNVASLVILDLADKPELLAEYRALNPKVKVLYLPYDVTKSIDELAEVFAAVLSKVPKIDVLINGAGILNEHLPQLTIQTNLSGLISTIIAVMKFWDKRHGGPGGFIVNIASAVSLEPYPLLAAYSASKAGVLAFTKCVAQVQAETGVSATIVCPGLVSTALIRSFSTFLDLDTQLSAKIKNLDVQSAEVCANHIITAIEKNENGSIWLVDNGTMELVPQRIMWQAPDLNA